MNETISVKKTGKSKFGEWILVDDGSEKGQFLSSSTQVNGFLSNQVPCTIEIEEKQDIEDRKGVVTRVKVLGKVQPVQQQMPCKVEDGPMEEKIEVVKPGIEPASNYKPSANYYETQDKRQESIVTQMSIKTGAELLDTAMKEDKDIKVTDINLLKYSEMVRRIYDTMIEKNKLPNY